MRPLLDRIRRELGFLYNQRSLAIGREELAAIIAERLGRPVRLRRFIRGRGWGLKYLVMEGQDKRPSWVAKVASLGMERRLRQAVPREYRPHPERFHREAATLEALARLGLGPEVLLVHEHFFVRRWLIGLPLDELPPLGAALALPLALEALDRACAAGVLHTDPASGNLLIDPSQGRISLIDSEIPGPDHRPGEPVSAVERKFCHERLLWTLGRALRERGRKPEREGVLQAARGWYGQAGAPLEPERAAGLLTGQISQMELPRR